MALKILHNLNNMTTGINVTYVPAVPANNIGQDNDIVILTTNGSHYKKVTGVWTLQLSETLGSSSVLVYADRTALLAAVGSAAYKIGVVVTEVSNTYLRNSTNTQWVVMSGNSYTTVNLPSTTDFVIPSGTPVFNATTLKWVYE